MKNRGNINFVLVGTRATGKTVYLASLYLYAKNITSHNDKTTNYLKPIANELNDRIKPKTTSANITDLMFDYKNEKISTTIQIDDFDGYYIETLSEQNHTDKKEKNKLLEQLELSEGIIFFFPYGEEFNDERIKDFNYQIDKIISQLNKFYLDRKSIPIPVVIAVSQWDKSVYYKSENELEKAIGYIEDNIFLKLAKEKIEENFLKLKIIPMSSLGTDIESMKPYNPYNIEKPIEFFLEETYKVWIDKINSLKDNPKEQFIFLSKIYFDIKSYGKYQYRDLYNKLEKDFSKELFNDLKSINTIDEYIDFEKRNNKLIDALSPESQNKILEKKRKLSKDKQTISLIKNLKILAIASIIMVLGYFVWEWKIRLLFVKSENELFSTIQSEYKIKNFDKALKDIDDYIEVYGIETVNIEHKNKIIELKTNIEREKIIAQAENILSDSNFENLNEIDKVLKAMLEKNIDDIKLKKRLIEKKNIILLKSKFDEFKNKVEAKNIEDAINYIENHWQDIFEKKHKEIIRKILDKRINKKIENILKDISNIYDFYEYKNLVDKLSKIESLKNNTKIPKIDYKLSLNSNNQKEINKQEEIRDKYTKILNRGITGLNITFGAESEENEPLGFTCGGLGNDDEIILKIDSTLYNYKNSSYCNGTEIFWKNSSQLFKPASYPINVTEEEAISDDKYSASIELSETDLIKLYNLNEIKKDIGSGYYIKFQKGN